MASTLRRSTCRVSLKEGLQYLDLARALYTQVSPDSVHAIQPLSKMTFQVTFKNDKFFKKAMDNGLVHISGDDYEFVPVDGLTRWISVRDVPIWIEQPAFIAAFTPYGQVLQYQEEEWPQLPGVKNGNRKIQIKMIEQNSVPNILKVGQGHRARVFYPGVEFLCFKCKQKGHKFAECPQRTRSETNLPSCNTAAATNQVTSEAIPDPSTAFPVLSASNEVSSAVTQESPTTSISPPVTSQMRRWRDPLEEPETNKDSSRKSASLQDLISAGTFGPVLPDSIDQLSLAALQQLINETTSNQNSDDDNDSENDFQSPTKFVNLVKDLLPSNSGRPPSSLTKRRSSRSPDKTSKKRNQ